MLTEGSKGAICHKGSMSEKRKVLKNVRFKVLTLLLMKIQVFWEVAPCCLVNTS